MWESVQGIRVFTFASKRPKALKVLFKGTKGKQTILQLCTEYLGLEWMQGWKVTKSWFDRNLTFFQKNILNQALKHLNATEVSVKPNSPPALLPLKG